MVCKTYKQKQKMRDACRAAATVLDRLCDMVAPGVSTHDIDQEGKRLMDEFGVKSACYGYRAGSRAFPAYTCLSVNDEVVHGIGDKKRFLKEGDVISVDVCVSLDGHIGDNCRTVPVGSVSPDISRLLKVTEEAMHRGIAQAIHGNRVGDVSHAVQRCVEGAGFAVITNFVGHGVGKSLHEEPQIPNYGKAGSGPVLKRGLTVAIEPMVNMRKKDISMAADGWTALTVDGMPSAHFEHTVMVDKDRPEILTLPEGDKHLHGEEKA